MVRKTTRITRGTEGIVYVKLSALLHLKIFRSGFGLSCSFHEGKRACAFVEDGEQLLSVCVRAVAVYPKRDERTNANVQPETPASGISIGEDTGDLNGAYLRGSWETITKFFHTGS